MTVTLAQIFFLISAIALSVLVLLQQTKGSGMGASFGGGASSTVFGARGAGSFIYKTTRFLAAIFFISALALGYFQNKSYKDESILQQTQLEVETTQNVAIPTSQVDNTKTDANHTIPSAAPENKE